MRRVPAPVYLALLVAWCALVWWLSGKSRPGETVGWALELPDWLLHGLEYAAGGFLAYGAFRSLGAHRALAAACGFCLAYGVLDELHQSFVPLRDASPIDVVADLIGGTIGAALHWMLGARTAEPAQDV